MPLLLAPLILLGTGSILALVLFLIVESLCDFCQFRTKR